jgi:hypothetical protein
VFVCGFCPFGVALNAGESIERHVVSCPHGGMRHLVHAWLVHSVKAILKEARELRAVDNSTPGGDVVSLDFFAEGRHRVIDVVAISIYHNYILSLASSIPGYATKHAEDMKIVAHRNSVAPIETTHGGPHVLVPFAIEDGGAHAKALLKSLAMTNMAKDMTPPLPGRSRVIYTLMLFSKLF